MATDKEVRDAVLLAVRDIKANKGSSIKVELEAQLNRSADSGDRETCRTCTGEGYMDCDDCNAHGWYIDEDGEETDEECETCNTDGRRRCTDCNGLGYTMKLKDGKPIPAWRETNVCFNWLMQRIAEKTNTKLKSLERDAYQATLPFSWMKFARFYYDGSVDSEFTFTVLLTKSTNIFYIPIVIEAFREMGEAIGRGIRVSGAGMHTAVLFSPDGSYRGSEYDCLPFTATYQRNFMNANYQLLPALFFLGSSNGFSRGLGSRQPRIDMDGYDKYSAIHRTSCALEYRVFDTCYDTPETFLDNVCVIANTLRFMRRTYLDPGVKAETKLDSLRFGVDGNGNSIERMFQSVKHLDVLDSGLKQLKPSYKTVDELKRERKFTLTRKKLENLEVEYQKQAQMEYDEYAERFEVEKKQREYRIRGQAMEQLVRELPITDLRRMTQADIRKRVADRVKSEMELFTSGKTKADTYIKNRLDTLKRASKGDYSLYFN